MSQRGCDGVVNTLGEPTVGAREESIPILADKVPLVSATVMQPMRTSLLALRFGRHRRSARSLASVARRRGRQALIRVSLDPRVRRW